MWVIWGAGAQRTGGRDAGMEKRKREREGEMCVLESERAICLCWCWGLMTIAKDK